MCVQFSHLVVSNSLRPHGLQHTRPPCPSPTPGVYSNSCPLSHWCHPTISSSAVPSCPQSFPISESFPMLTPGGQSIGDSASVLPMNIQGWFPLGLTSLISLLSRNSQESSPALQFESINSSMLSLLYDPFMTTEKTIALTKWTFVNKLMSLLFNMLSMFVIAFLPWNKCLLISRLQSQSAVILEPKKIKSVTVSIVSPSIYHEVMGLDAMIIVFWMLSFKPAFSLSFFTFIKRLFLVPSCCCYCC